MTSPKMETTEDQKNNNKNFFIVNLFKGTRWGTWNVYPRRRRFACQFACQTGQLWFRSRGLHAKLVGGSLSGTFVGLHSSIPPNPLRLSFSAAHLHAVCSAKMWLLRQPLQEHLLKRNDCTLHLTGKLKILSSRIEFILKSLYRKSLPRDVVLVENYALCMYMIKHLFRDVSYSKMSWELWSTLSYHCTVKEL